MKKIYFSVLLGLLHFFAIAQTEFITTWKTDNPGISSNNQITIPTFPGETYDYTVDWGDGSSDMGVTGDITHTYTNLGTYQVSITGDFPRIYFNYDGVPSNIGDKDKIISVDQWGTQAWASMESAFKGCSNLDVLASDTPNLTNVTSVFEMFYLCSSLNGTSVFNDWDVSNIENFEAMFRGATLFNQNIANWNMSNAQNLTCMFCDAPFFDQPIANWDVSNVTNMNSLFQGASRFNQDVGNWDTSNVTKMSGTFNGANAFNQDIGNWDVSNVTDMQGMLLGTTSFNQDLSNWDVSNVKNMSEMFFNALIFNQDIGNWDVSKVTQMFSMFEGAMDFDQSLGSWDVSNVTTMNNMFTNNALSAGNYDSTLIGWYQLPSLQNNVSFGGGFSQYCTSVVERLKLMYEKGWVIEDEGKTAGVCIQRPFISTWKTINPGVSAENQITIPTFPGETYNYTVDWGDGTSDNNVTGDITHTYASVGIYQISITGDFPRIYFNFFPENEVKDYEKLISIDQWGDIKWTSMEDAFARCTNMDVLAEDTPDLSNVESMGYMFRGCENLVGNISFSAWDVSNVLRMFGVFIDASLFNQDIGRWDVSRVTDMGAMFSRASSFNQDISNWNVSNVTRMVGLFNGASSFNQGLNDWDVSNVTDMGGMFTYANSFNQNLNNWDVSNVLRMAGMFSSNIAFNQEIGNWDTSKVTDMSSMFFNATFFNQDISSWDVSNVRNMNSMFVATTFFNQNIGEWDVSNVINMSRMFANASSFNQDISNWNVSNVTNMSSMFSRATNFNQDISAWDVSSATEMASMFDLATSFDQDLNNWDVSNVTNMARMFMNATVFNGDVSNWNVSNVELMGNMFNGAASFNHDISNWNVANVTEMSGMFAGASPFDQDLGNWDVSNVTDMTSMLYGVTLSVANYDSLLKGWSSLPNLQSNVVFDAGNSQYCASSADKQSVIDSFGWTISDAGTNTDCLFVTTWKTDNPGISGDNQITIPTFSGETYDYDIDWGDGTFDTDVTGDITHTYASPGTYTVSISGNFPRIYFFGSTYTDESPLDNKKLISIQQWGSIDWSSMEFAFLNCTEMEVLAIDTPLLNNVTNLNSMFNGCYSMNGNGSFASWEVNYIEQMADLFADCFEFSQDIGSWDVSNVTNMSFLFSNAQAFNSDISSWDVSNVANMRAMFQNASTFNQDISSWDVSNVMDMLNMFTGASNFNQNIGIWNVSMVNTMNSMFANASAFDQDIGIWDVSNVTEISSMFENATSFNQNLNNWDVSNVTNMGRMFMGASLFNGDISNWNVSNVELMGNMFNGAASFNRDISNWNVANVTEMSEMLAGAMPFDQDLGNWDVSNVTDMTSMLTGVTLSTVNYDSLLNGWSSLPNLQSNVVFDAGNSQYCSSSAEKQSIIDTHGWTINDAGTNTECLFVTTWKTDNPGISGDNQITIPTFLGETYDYTVDWGDGSSDTNVMGNITHTYTTPGIYTVSIVGDFPRIYFDSNGDKDKVLTIENWGNIKWSSMKYAFSGCSYLNLEANDIPNFTQLTSLEGMFVNCTSLVGNESMMNWNIQNVTRLRYMFGGANKFDIDIGNWDVSMVTDMDGMFIDASSFNQNIGNWNVSNILSMNNMFDGSSSFNQDIGNWDVSNVVLMRAMFNGASKFNQPIGTWDVSSVTDMTQMFTGAEEFNQDIGSWNVSKVITMDAMFSGASSFDQNIGSWDVSNVSTMNVMFAGTPFNQNIGAWNVSQVTDMGGMFQDAILFNQDIGNWDVSIVTHMSSLFSGAVAFDQDLSNWDVSKVVNMNAMFSNNSLSIENYNSLLIGWSQLPLLQGNVYFEAGNSQYCEAEEARQLIIDTYGWTIYDIGKVPLCNEDNDADGVMDHLDACLNTQPGRAVNENGCDFIPNDAIQVYVLTPSCVGSEDGSIEISMNMSGYLLDILVDGKNFTNQYSDVSSDSVFEIDGLPEGAYTITISIPEILYEQAYGVTVNDIDSVSGKRIYIDDKTGIVSYSVSGSKTYNVSVNGQNTYYTFNDPGPQTLLLKNLNGQNEIIISGESDCQGKIMDNVYIGDSIQVFPTLVSDYVNIITNEKKIKALFYSMDGRLVKELDCDKVKNDIDISMFEAGVYYLKMSTGKYEENIKIVKK